jgi:hypothetical protein
MPLAIFTILLVPKRDAPSFIKSSASAREAMPPEALILRFEDICDAKSEISSLVAPPVEKPVEVFI